MAIVTATVTVNPAFLQEFKENNHELRQVLHHTGAMFARPREMRIEARRLVDLLEKLRDQLALHFSLEESYGYFEEALNVSPQLSRRAEAMRSQHSAMYVDICRIVEAAQKLVYEEHVSWRTLRPIAADFAVFHRTLQKHEAGENALILEAFAEEMGAGD